MVEKLQFYFDENGKCYYVGQILKYYSGGVFIGNIYIEKFIVHHSKNDKKINKLFVKVHEVGYKTKSFNVPVDRLGDWFIE